MVQLNKDERLWVCFEIARVQNAHAVQRLWPNCWPGRRVPTIHAILKNYRKYSSMTLAIAYIEIK